MNPGGDHDAADADAMVLDELGADDTAAYRIKLSKWKQGTFHCIQCPLFWYLVGICRIVRSPLRHFMLYVQKQTAAHAGECLFHLVTGKLTEFKEEFREAFRSLPELMHAAMKMSGCDTLPEEDIAKLRLVTRKLLLQHWAAFMRRVIKPLSQRPETRSAVQHYDASIVQLSC